MFLTGKPEIEKVGRELDKVPKLIVIPAHAELPPSELDRIHEEAPPGARKVVLATNLAETSLTVDGIVFVVDHGFMKITKYDGQKGEVHNSHLFNPASPPASLELECVPFLKLKNCTSR